MFVGPIQSDTLSLYLLGSSESVIEAGHVGHDGSFIWFGGVDDIWEPETEHGGWREENNT